MRVVPSRARAAASSTASGKPSRSRQTRRTPSVVLGQGVVIPDGLGSIDERANGRKRGQPSIGRSLRQRGYHERADGTPARPGAEAPCGRREAVRPGQRPSSGRGLGARHRRPVRGRPGRATWRVRRSADQDCPGAGAYRPSRSRPPRRRCQARPARAERSKQRRRTPSPADSDRIELLTRGYRQPVLPMPPGPVQGDQPVPGDSSNSTTATMSCSPPINDVDVTGRERGSAAVGADAGRSRRGRRDCRRARTARSGAGARSSRTSRRSSRGDETTGTSRSPPTRSSPIMARPSPRFSVERRRVLTYSSRGTRRESRNSVLQTRDVHARPDPAGPLPIHADEDVARPRRHARYRPRGGCGRAPLNSTGVSEVPRWRRGHHGTSSASSPSVELTKTCRR